MNRVACDVGANPGVLEHVYIRKVCVHVSEKRTFHASENRLVARFVAGFPLAVPKWGYYHEH